MGNRYKKDGKNRRKVCNVAYKGPGEEGKDAATVDRHNAVHCCKKIVEEGLSLSGNLLCVEFLAEEGWFI